MHAFHITMLVILAVVGSYAVGSFIIYTTAYTATRAFLDARERYMRDTREKAIRSREESERLS